MQFSYTCSKCDAKASSTNKADRIERFISTDKKSTTVSVRGLGTWRCPVHGKVSVRRVKVSQGEQKKCA